MGCSVCGETDTKTFGHANNCAEEKREKRAATIQGLRDMAAFLETHDKAPLPFVSQVNAFPDDDADIREIAKSIGYAEKNLNGPWLYLVKNFGPVGYKVTIEREKVCTKKVIGTRTVPAHEEELVEWSCSDSILADKETA